MHYAVFISTHYATFNNDGDGVNCHWTTMMLAVNDEMRRVKLGIMDSLVNTDGRSTLRLRHLQHARHSQLAAGSVATYDECLSVMLKGHC